MTMRSTKKPRLADANEKENETRGDALDSTADLLRQTTAFSLRLLSMLQQLADVDPFALLVESNFAPAHLRDELIRKRRNALQLHKIPGDCANTIIEFLHVPEACVLQRACRGSLAMVKRSLQCPRARAVSYRGKLVDGHILKWLVRVYRVCPKFKLAESCRYWASISDLWLKIVDEGPGINSKAVHALLDNTDVDPNCIRQEGLRTVLWSATYINDVELVRRLLTYPKLDVNSRYEGDLSTPFIVAGFFDHEEITRLLLADPRCDVTLRAKERSLEPCETTVVHFSVSRRSFRVLEVLLASPRVDPNMRNTNGATALRCALSSSHAGAHEAVQKLLACSRVDANERDRTENTPLHFLCGLEEGHHKFCDLLLRREDIDKNAKNNKGESILMHAVNCRAMHIIRSLLADEDVDVDCVDNRGYTALHHAVQSNVGFEKMAMCINALCDSGRFDSTARKHGSVALYFLLARQEISREALEALLRFPGINVNKATHPAKDTPLHIAIRRGYPDYVELLLAVPGIDLELRNADTWTPVVYACKLARSNCGGPKFGRSKFDLKKDNSEFCSRVRVFELLLNAQASNRYVADYLQKMLPILSAEALHAHDFSILKMVLGTPRPGFRSWATFNTGSMRETALQHALRMNPGYWSNIKEDLVAMFKEARRRGI